MTDAKKFLTVPHSFCDINRMMESLDELNLDTLQDFSTETTTWVFGDGSAVRISGNDYESLDSLEISEEVAELEVMRDGWYQIPPVTE